MPHLPVFDGHNDALLRYRPAGPAPVEEFLARADGVCVDLPRAREGGLAGGMFAVFVEDERSVALFADFDPATSPAMPALDPGFAKVRAHAMVANLRRIAEISGGAAEVVTDSTSLRRAMGANVLAMVLHFEGAEPIDAALGDLEAWYGGGLRSLGLAWSRPNAFAHGVPFTFPHSPDTGPGLTSAGDSLVRACNDLGIVLDLSHLNERGFWDVARTSRAPLVASHSNAWALCPSPRNLTDAQLDAIRETGGIVGLNLLSAFAREDGRDDPTTPLETWVHHVEYLVSRVGIDGVGIGADLGVPSYLPDAFADATAYPRLLGALAARGFDAASLEKIASGNWRRVLAASWR